MLHKTSTGVSMSAIGNEHCCLCVCAAQCEHCCQYVYCRGRASAVCVYALHCVSAAVSMSTAGDERVLSVCMRCTV